MLFEWGIFVNSWVYKKVESKVSKNLSKFSGNLFAVLLAWIKRAFESGRQAITIMLVPHSRSKIYHIKINVFALVFLSVTVLLGLVAFVLLAANWTDVQRVHALSIQERDMAQASIQAIQAEVGELRRISNLFEQSVSQTLQTVGLQPSNSANSSGRAGDLESLQQMQATGVNGQWEVGELRNLRGLLASTIDPLGQIGNLLSTQRKLLQDIPSLWPLQGGIGWVTFPFGPAIHPFTGRWYTHTGIDIAHQIGSPIIATGNGVVRKVEYDMLGYGIHIEIEHSYGFSTIYAHLQRAYVSKGDKVKRGQVIAALGSTGQSTGPHLHYEVRIAKQVVDPASYLNIASGFIARR